MQSPRVGTYRKECASYALYVIDGIVMDDPDSCHLLIFSRGVESCDVGSAHLPFNVEQTGGILG